MLSSGERKNKGNLLSSHSLATFVLIYPLSILSIPCRLLLFLLLFWENDCHSSLNLIHPFFLSFPPAIHYNFYIRTSIQLLRHIGTSVRLSPSPSISTTQSHRLWSSIRVFLAFLRVNRPMCPCIIIMPISSAYLHLEKINHHQTTATPRCQSAPTESALMDCVTATTGLEGKDVTSQVSVFAFLNSFFTRGFCWILLPSVAFYLVLFFLPSDCYCFLHARSRRECRRDRNTEVKKKEWWSCVSRW